MRCMAPVLPSVPSSQNPGAARNLRCFLSSHWGAQVYASLCRDASEGGEPAPPLWRAFTYELCAGLVDKAMTLPEIAAEEVGALLRRLGHLVFDIQEIWAVSIACQNQTGC